MPKPKMNKKHPNGMKNAIDIDTVSAMYPIKTGAMAPPTIDIIRNDDALLVCSPNPLMANAKIVGNMIDSQRKQRKKLLTPSIPEVKIAEIIAMLAQTAYDKNFLGKYSTHNPTSAHATYRKQPHANE